MGRPARPWFRFYVEAFSDRKLLRLTPAQRWLWVAVLGAARDSCEPGRLMISEGEPMTTAELARFADVPVDDVWPALEQMRRYGMVAWDEDGLISVCNWDSRQFESDPRYYICITEPDRCPTCGSTDKRHWGLGCRAADGYLNPWHTEGADR